MNGLLAKYWNGYTDTDAPFPTRTPDAQRLESQIDYSDGEWQPSGIDSDFFAASWEGQLATVYSEDYTLDIVKDDGIRLYINGILVLDTWNGHPDGSTSPITFTAGIRTSIRVEYCQTITLKFIHLYWQSASQAHEIIPVTAFFPHDLLPPTDPIKRDGPLIYYTLDDLENAPSNHAKSTGILTLTGLYGWESSLKGFGAPGARSFSLYSTKFNDIRDGTNGILEIPVIGSWGSLSGSTEGPGRTQYTFLTDYTFECYVRCRNPQANGFLFRYGITNSSGGTGIYLFLNSDDSGKIRLGATEHGWNFGFFCESLIPVSEDRWTLISFTYSTIDHKYRLYVDGIFQSSFEFDNTILDFNGDGHIRMTTSGVGEIDNSDLLYLDNIAIFDRCLSDGEIANHWSPDDRDFLLLTDTVKVNMIYNRAITHTLPLDDFRGRKSNIEQDLSLSDYVSPKTTFHLNLIQILPLVDGLRVLETNSKIIEIIDPLILSDFVFLPPIYYLNDSLDLFDLVDTPGLKFDNIRQELLLVDFISIEIPHKAFYSLSDHLLLYDFISVIDDTYHLKDFLLLTDILAFDGLPVVEIKKDILSFSDKVRVNLFVINIKDFLILQDTARPNFYPFEIIDPLTLVDRVHLNLSIFDLNDSLELTEQLDLWDLSQQLVDDLILTDNLNAGYKTVNYQLNDLINLIEDLKYIPSPMRITDELLFIETMGQQHPYEITDTLSLTQSAIRVEEFSIISDLVLLETLEFQAAKSLTDLLVMIDGTCYCLLGNNHLSDNLSMSEGLLLLLNDQVPGNPAPIKNPGITITTVYNKRISQFLTLTDRIDSIEPIKVCCE